MACALVLGLMFACWLATEASAQAPNSNDDYRLNVGDIVEFDILGDDEPAEEYAIGTEGRVRLPFIGGVRVVDLTVGEARELIHKTYIDRELFQDPMIELSVAKFRKVTVLGNVVNPGLYDYETLLTAEQAVGLAGGPALAQSDPEVRILRRRELEADLAAVDADLARGSSIYARLSSQLAGRERVSLDDVPASIRRYVDPVLFDSFASLENEIIEVEQRNHGTQVALLEDSISESQTQLSLIAKRVEYAEASLAAAEEARERAEQLFERGIVALDAKLEATRTINGEAALLAGVLETRATVSRELGGFRAELSSLESDRRSLAMKEMQVQQLDLGKLVGARQSIEDQLRMIEQWMSGSSVEDKSALVRYMVRRRGRDGSVQLLQLTPFDSIEPGDVLNVSVLPPDLEAQVVQ